MQNRSCTVVGLADLLPQREFRCQSCPGKVYKTRARYQDHLKQTHQISTETEKRLFNCYHCPCRECRQHKHTQGATAFRDITQLRRHYRISHMTKNFICAFCEREFDLERELFLHKCCPPNIVDAEDQSSPGHVTHQDVSKTDTTRRKEHSSLNTLRLNLFHDKSIAVDQQLVSQRKNNENKPKPSTGRPMQKCTQCKRKYIQRHRCSEHPCQECSRVFFSKSSLENHMRKNTHCLRAEDIIFVDEIIQLLSGIEDGAIRNPSLVRELADLLPVLQKIQGP